MLLTKEKNLIGELIGSSKELDLEIGFGKGGFLLGKARHYPEVNIIGYEIRKKWVDRVNKFIEAENLKNIYVEYAYADAEVPEKIPAGRLRHIYINFPDPWWKRRHKKRRILQKSFIDMFYNALSLNGKIYIRTDVRDYAENVEEIFAGIDCFQKIEHDIIDDNVLSDREARCKEDELDIYYLAYQKIK